MNTQDLPLHAVLKTHGYKAISFHMNVFYVLEDEQGLCGLYSSYRGELVLSVSYDSMHFLAKLCIVRRGSLYGAFNPMNEKWVVMPNYHHIVFGTRAVKKKGVERQEPIVKAYRRSNGWTHFSLEREQICGREGSATAQRRKPTAR